MLGGKMSEADRTEDGQRTQSGRGPAYPYVSLAKAVMRAEQLRDANMTRIAASALAIYKVWGWSGDNGNARQTMAALNQFGLVDYVGRGEDRQVRLSELAHKIVLDKVPGSVERAAALRVAALAPPIHLKLWDTYGASLPPDVVLETFLVRDCKFNQSGAENLIGEYRETFEFAALGHPTHASAIIQKVAMAQPAPAFFEPHHPPPTTAASEAVAHDNEREWLRGFLSKTTAYRLIISGDMGSREIAKLIKLLEAQKAVLDDDGD
jgi:hypothetical protein